MHLLRKGLQLYRHRRFRIADLADNLIGNPTAFPIPRSIRGAMLGLARHFLRMRRLPRPQYWRITEAQMRFFYYRTQIERMVGDWPHTILEIGGGYGGLAGELIRHTRVDQYFLVELPETIPLAYFYLQRCFDGAIQVLCGRDDRVNPGARIVLVAPWKVEALRDKIDLFINTMSFQHMTADAIQYYLGHVDRLETCCLYLVNRDSKRDPSDVPISQYPIPQSYTMSHNEPHLFGAQREVVYERESCPKE